jgi:DNA-binding FadR family transcriptional regulator
VSRATRAAPAAKNRHAHIVQDLGQRIVAGKILPGQRLPPEAELLARYGVSRTVLREVVRVLAAKGLLLARQRAGVTVRPREAWHLLDPDVLSWLIRSQPRAEFVETLLTVRRVFEPAVAALAAQRASDEAIQGVAEAYAGMERAATPQELLEPDLAFHRLIAEATGNVLLAYIGNMLSLALRESIKLSNRHPNAHAHTLSRHKAIVTALRARDPLAAHQACLVQLEETGGDISAVLRGAARLR